MKENQLSALYVVVIAAYYICSTGVLATCDSSFGPAGGTHCVMAHGYNDYQWTTCRTDTYIQTKSNTKHQCVDFTTYCDYKCMVDVYDKNSGDIFPHCKCSPDDPVPIESVPLPSWCYSPDGKNCSWYKECLNKAYPQCEYDGDDYGIKFAEKFCKLYNESYSEFSSQGQRWIDGVRKCLQLKLVPLVDKTRNKTCTDLKYTAFESHSPCYLNPDETSLSYCNLSLDDGQKVFWTIKSSFLDATVPSLNGLLEVMSECTRATVQSYVYKAKAKINEAVDAIIGQDKKTAAYILKETKARIKAWLEDTVSPIPIQLDLFIESNSLHKFFNRQKRSLAGNVLDAVAIEENWKEKGVAWFGYETASENNTTLIRLVVGERYKYDVGSNSLSETKAANLTTTLVELSEAVLKANLNLMVEGERVTIIKLNGCLDWDCKEHAFNITALKLQENNGTATNETIHTETVSTVSNETPSKGTESNGTVSSGTVRGECSGAVMYRAMYILLLPSLVINILFIPIS